MNQMGFTYLKVFVGNPTELARGREVEFLVDTGSFYTMIPRAILEEVGVVPMMEKTFILANGGKIGRQVGVANLVYKGQPGGTLVIFGEEGDKTLLGVLGLGIQSRSRQRGTGTHRTVTDLPVIITACLLARSAEFVEEVQDEGDLVELGFGLRFRGFLRWQTSGRHDGDRNCAAAIHHFPLACSGDMQAAVPRMTLACRIVETGTVSLWLSLERL